jgi:hypothetical protein
MGAMHLCDAGDLTRLIQGDGLSRDNVTQLIHVDSWIWDEIGQLVAVEGVEGCWARELVGVNVLSRGLVDLFRVDEPMNVVFLFLSG